MFIVKTKHRLTFLVIFLVLLLLGLIVMKTFKAPVAVTSDQGSLAQDFGAPVLVSGINAEYISAVNWPPQVASSSIEFSCEVTPEEGSGAKRVSRKILEDREYCVTAMSEGAAGSVYTDYNYTTKVAGELLSFNFTLRYPSCLNYDNPAQSVCQKERESFNLDAVVSEFVKNYLK